MKSLPAFLSSCILLVFLISCGGGGHLEPPIILALTPSPLDGPSGKVLTLGLQLEGEATSFHWEFGDGIYPAESNDAMPRIRLTRPGTYELRVTASNAQGVSPTIIQEYAVSELPDPQWRAGVSPAYFGRRGGLAVIGGLPMAASYDNPSDTATAYIGRISAPTTAGEWSDRIFISDASLIQDPIILVIENRVLVVFRDNSDNPVKLATADWLPSGLSPWNVTDVLSGEHWVNLQLISHLGQPLLYGGDQGGLDPSGHLLLANTPVPLGPSDWTELENPAQLVSRHPPVLQSQGGLLELLLDPDAPNRDLIYLSTTASRPTKADWTYAPLGDSADHQHQGLFHSAGQTFAVMGVGSSQAYSHIRIAIAASPRPIGEGQWTSYEIPSPDARAISCQVFDERPLILYTTDPLPMVGDVSLGDKRLISLRAITPEPIFATDWVQADLLLDPPASLFGATALKVGDGISVFTDSQQGSMLRTESLW